MTTLSLSTLSFTSVATTADTHLVEIRHAEFPR